MSERPPRADNDNPVPTGRPRSAQEAEAWVQRLNVESRELWIQDCLAAAVDLWREFPPERFSSLGTDIEISYILDRMTDDELFRRRVLNRFPPK